MTGLAVKTEVHVKVVLQIYKGYQCVCLPGFTSAHCEKGIGNSTVT